MLIDHGTFTQYTPATPVIPARPVEPPYPTSFVPVPSDPGPESNEARGANAAIIAAYEGLVDAYRADLAAWEADTATDRRVKAQLEAGGIFCKSGDVDWYTIALATPAPGRRFVLVSGDRVAAIDSDPSRLWPLGYRVLETDDEDVAGDWRLVNGALVDPGTIPPTVGELAAYVAAKRWAREVGGCVVDGHQVATDRDSQAKLLAEFVAIGAGARADPNPWKFADGEFANLTNVQMLAVCMGARAHIANAFAVEAQVLAAISAGTVTTTAQIDAAF